MNKLRRIISTFMIALLSFGPNLIIATPVAATSHCTTTVLSGESIQAVVNAASAGDVVCIAAGTFDEQIVIDGKNLTLQGAGDTTILQPSAPTTLTSSYTYPSGVLSGWAGLKLASPILVTNSSNVTVKDLKVDGINVTSAPAGADRLSGVLFGEAGGVISNVTVNNIKTTGYSVRTYAIDVSSVGSALSIEIANSRVNDFARGAIQAQGANLTANIHDNVVVGPGTIGPANVPNGIVLIAGATGTVTNNTVSANHYTGSSYLASGILLYQAANGVTVSNNHVYDVDDAVLIAGTSASTVSNNNLHNNVKGVQIEQSGATNNTLTGNSITDNTYGIFLSSSAGSGNSASSNTITSSTTASVNNESSNTLNALNNWWGVANPSFSNITGTGGATTSPWCEVSNCSSSRSFNVYIDADLSGTQNGAEETFETIQSAITAATAGNTIRVLSGTYAESLTLDKAINLRGADDNATTGTVIAPYDAGTQVTIGASDITISDLYIDRQGAGNAINISGSALNNITISGVTVTGAAHPSTPLTVPGTGLRVSSSTSINGLTVTNSHFDGNDIGWYIAKESANSSTVTNVNVSNSSFSNNTMKGLYAEKLENALFDQITVSNSGTLSSYGFNAGVDVNLKWSSYSNIEFRNSTISGSGLLGSASNPLNPTAITIKARDDAPSYSSPSASLTNVTLSNLVIAGGVNGIRIGETAKNNAGPSNVTVTGSSIDATTGYALVNQTSVSINAANNWWGDVAGAGSNVSGTATTTPWYINAGRTVLNTEVSTEEPETITPPTDLELPSETPGEAALPSGTDTIVFSPEKVIDLANNTQTINISDPVVVTPPVIGGQTVVVDKQVELTSGTGNAITIQNSATPTVTLEIPNNTTIYAPNAWDGTITPPTTTTTTGSAPSGFSFGGTALKVGSDAVTLVFDQAVTLLLRGVNSPVGYQAAGSSTWNLIEPCGGTYDAPATPVFPGECYKSNGTDTKIITYHFTTFAALSENPDPAPTPAPAPTPTPNSGNQQQATPAQLAVAETPAAEEGTVAAEQDSRDISSTQTDEPSQTPDSEQTSRWTLWYSLLLGAITLGVVYYALVRRKRR